MTMINQRPNGTSPLSPPWSVEEQEACFAVRESRRLAEDPMTLAELANEFGVSRERVRQIEARAFEKVQKIMNRVDTIETPAQKPMH